MSAAPISKYQTLSACLELMEGLRHQICRGLRGIEPEEGCEMAFEIFTRHESNIRDMMKTARYGGTGHEGHGE